MEIAIFRSLRTSYFKLYTIKEFLITKTCVMERDLVVTTNQTHNTVLTVVSKPCY